MKVSLASQHRELYDKVGSMQSKITEEGISLGAPDSQLCLPHIQNTQQTLESQQSVAASIQDEHVQAKLRNVLHGMQIVMPADYAAQSQGPH